jgi:predicted outer membrane lipoprotein
MNEVRKLERQTIKYAVIGAALMTAVFFAVFDSPTKYVLGLLFGCAIGILNFMELAKTLSRAVELSPQKAQSYTTRKYFIRYVIYGVVLWVSIQADYIHVLGTIVGLLLIKVVLLTTNLFNDKHYFLNIFRRKEDE